MLTAVYDLNVGTIAYDFITWLARAKLEQQRRGADGLHIVIVPATNGLGGFGRNWGPHDAAQTYWRLWHIVIAACPLAGATVTLAPTREYAQFVIGAEWAPPGKSHFLGPLVDAARAGETIPMLKPSAQAMRWAQRWTAGKRVVTLTLRNNNPQDGRDSSLDVVVFGEWLRKAGWDLCLLPDTNDALKQPFGPYAALSIDLRAALYASAAMNCFSHNGPMVLAWHVNAPYLAFGAGLPAEHWHGHWRELLSLEIGDQLPWASDNQRLIYRPDTLEVLVDEFQKWSAAAA